MGVIQDTSLIKDDHITISSKQPNADTKTPQQDGFSTKEGYVLSVEHVDTALVAKTKLITEAIDEIGMTTYHWKLFALNGFG